ncbi:hypothetical protein A7979_02235 [Rothia nasimurium]|uniref:Uncharacterized protein n=1 Tax=Rothia nasimurium TaxID=85336 RepID=A0A1Y1RPL0_9MICC|nr:hypothetical protein A7979_02235 [Rothia nasimurium]
MLEAIASALILSQDEREAAQQNSTRASIHSMWLRGITSQLLSRNYSMQFRQKSNAAARQAT